MDNRTKSELGKINELLQNKSFAFQMALQQFKAYHIGIHKEVPEFISEADSTSTIEKKFEEQRIATHIAGFYAVECVVNLLCARHSSTPVEILTAMIDESPDPEWIFLLERFTNAVWKAGQPFKGLEKINRSKFVGADALSVEDLSHIKEITHAAARKMKEDLLSVSNESTHQQMERIQVFLHSVQYTKETAELLYMVSSRLRNRNEPFIPAEKKNSTVLINAADEKIAINLAGFYALEAGLNYFVTKTNIKPTDLLRMIVDDSLHETDQILFARFANATWKAGQPFRSLDRISRETFRPFYFLSADDIEKDKVQIKAAARFLANHL